MKLGIASLGKRAAAWSIQAAVVVLVAAIVPRTLCGREAGAFYRRDAQAVRALSNVVAARTEAGITPADLHTGSAHFDGEWALVSNQMAVLGLGQHLLLHPEDEARYLPAIRAAVSSMLAPAARAFGTKLWGEDGLHPHALSSDHGHVYLGYLALALGMARRVDAGMAPEAKGHHDALCAALERRLERSPHGLIETFPGVTFPADVSSAVGAVAMHARVTNRPSPPFLEAWSRTFRARWVDPTSGLVYQTGHPLTGVPTSTARGSGTALIIYFLSFADGELARELDAAVALRGSSSFLGFGGVREYPDGAEGRGDIDSGPVVFGVSVSATGFGLAGPRLFADEGRFGAIYRTAHLFGAPVSVGAGRSFLAGPGLGDAILLAMLTAGPGGATRTWR